MPSLPDTPAPTPGCWCRCRQEAPQQGEVFAAVGWPHSVPHRVGSHSALPPVGLSPSILESIMSPSSSIPLHFPGMPPSPSTPIPISHVIALPPPPPLRRRRRRRWRGASRSSTPPSSPPSSAMWSPPPPGPRYVSFRTAAPPPTTSSHPIRHHADNRVPPPPKDGSDLFWCHAGEPQ